MGRRVKHDGGSRVRSFRVPILGYDFLTGEIQKLIDGFDVEEYEKKTKKDPDESKLVKAKNPDSEKKSPSEIRIESSGGAGQANVKRGKFVWACGCIKENGLFKRHMQCKKETAEHKEI
jgi:hypothetical protein